MDYDGAKTVCDVYISNEGTVSLKKCNVSDKTIEYTYGNKIYENGDVVYFDVTTGESCDDYKEENSNTGYNGIGGTENQNGCLKFYTFNDFGSDKLNLILDHNTTALMIWNSSESNINGPSEEFLNKLNEDTKNWIGTEIPTNYSIDQSTQASGAKYQIDYSDYKARIITAQEIAIITNNTSWNETTANNYYYFDTNSNNVSTTGFNYGWLYDITQIKKTSLVGLDYTSSTTRAMSFYVNNISQSDTKVKSNTSSTTKYSIPINKNNAQELDNSSFSVLKNSNGNFGIRPVIEILKTKLEKDI